MTWGKPAPISPPELLQRELFCGHVVNWFVKLTQLKYQPSKSSADHFPSACQHMVMVQRCLSHPKDRKYRGGNQNARTPISFLHIYTLKLFKIYGLHDLILLKNKTNNPLLTHEMHPSLNKCQRFCWDLKLYTLSLITFRVSKQFFTDQIHEPNLISSCFFPSLSCPLPVLDQFNLFPLKFILRRWLALNMGKKKVSLS